METEDGEYYVKALLDLERLVRNGSHLKIEYGTNNNPTTIDGILIDERSIIRWRNKYGRH